jgi:DNA-binding transcriptional MerR regulator
MLISELAQRAEVHPETIRRLEKRGLITSTRDVNGWRHYPREAVDQIRKLYAKTGESQSGQAPETVR